MTRRLVGAAISGIVGTALLLALGLWQVQRLHWKTALLADIRSQIAAVPVPLPADPDPAADRFLPVTATGEIRAEALRVMTTDSGGPAFRIVSPFETGGRTVLLDRGVIPVETPVPPPPAGEVTVAGNLLWPEASGAFTPAPDRDARLWYARDIASMADALGTDALYIVAREVPGDAVSPRPIDTTGIPNDHLQYAITWFSLAAIWAGMTVTLVWRIRRRSD